MKKLLPVLAAEQFLWEGSKNRFYNKCWGWTLVKSDPHPTFIIELNYYNGVLPDGEPDNICFVNDVAWGGGDSLSMPIAYVYGHDVYIHDWIFDRRDKSCTKPRVVAKILQHKIKMGRTEANNGG